MSSFTIPAATPTALTALFIFGCGAPALYGPHTPPNDSSVVVDERICIVSALHGSLHSTGERCGPAVFTIPAGDHQLLAVYRVDLAIEDSQPFLLDLRARSGHRYRITAVAMVVQHVRLVAPCNMRGAIDDDGLVPVELPERIGSADLRGGPVVYSRTSISDGDLENHGWRRRCMEDPCTWCR
jgi:hypothetical protein